MGREQAIVGLPRSVPELSEYCRDNLLLDECTLYIGRSNARLGTNSEVINGDYGIAQLDSKSVEVVARAGFVIENDDLVITHMPQAHRPSVLDLRGKRAAARLRSRDFRAQMVSQIVDIARSIGLVEILAVPAALYANVENEIAEYEYVYDRVDAVLKRTGFTLDGQRYRLNSS